MTIRNALSKDCHGWRIVHGKSCSNIQAAAANPHSGYESTIAAPTLVMFDQAYFELVVIPEYLRFLTNPATMERYRCA